MLDTVGSPVVRQESWVAMAANAVKKFLNPQARPATTQKEGDMPMTAEERAELAQEIGTVIAANMKPLSDKVDALQANQEALAKSVSAPAEAAVAAKRAAVAAVHGEVVANALTGDALDVMHAALATPAPAAAALAGNASAAAAPNATPNPAEYFPA